jgi:hypothetical protein
VTAVASTKPTDVPIIATIVTHTKVRRPILPRSPIAPYPPAPRAGDR